MRHLRKNSTGSEHWISLSDIMTALMMIFLLISVIYMIKVKEAVDIPKLFKTNEQELYTQMNHELNTILKKWGAILNPDLTVRFNNHEILFGSGSSQLSPQFKQALDEFFPHYIKNLMKDQYLGSIKEIRIEGHTSSHWAVGVDQDIAYIQNMQLPQSRAQNTLIYLLNYPGLSKNEKDWLKKKFRAIGYSSAATLGIDGKPASAFNVEDKDKSQRVEFRVVTDTEDRIRKIAYGEK